MHFNRFHPDRFVCDKRNDGGSEKCENLKNISLVIALDAYIRPGGSEWINARYTKEFGSPLAWFLWLGIRLNFNFVNRKRPVWLTHVFFQILVEFGLPSP